VVFVFDDEQDMSGFSLAVLFRRVGESVNFKLLRSLTHSSYMPNELGELHNMSKSKVSNQLGKLRRLGFVSWKKPVNEDGRHRLYSIRCPLPTAQHEILIQMIKIDVTDPDQNFQKERERAAEKKKLQEKIQKKTKQLFRTKLNLLAAGTQLPVGMMGREQKKLWHQIKELENEIINLQAEELENKTSSS
jgi:predicted transcriptional regulator